MVGPFTSIFSREESLPIQAICATYRARPARAHWGTPEVLPALQSILLEEFKPSEPVEKGIAQFILRDSSSIALLPFPYSRETEIHDW